MKKAGITLLALGLLAGAYFAFIVRTPYGHRAVIWPDNAVAEREPGFSLALRPLQSVYFVDVREQRLLTVNDEGKANGLVQTSDLQEIFLRASLIWRIQPDRAAEVYDAIGNVDKALPIISAIFYDAIKEAGGRCLPDAEGACQRTALSFASDLSVIAPDIEAIITPQLSARGIEVLSVAIEDAVFDDAFLTSIKEKVIADQEAEEQRRLVEAEAAKKQQIRLQAEAQELRRIELGLSPAEYLELLWLDKWNGQLPATVVGESSDVLVNVP